MNRSMKSQDKAKRQPKQQHQQGKKKEEKDDPIIELKWQNNYLEIGFFYSFEPFTFAFMLPFYWEY